MLTEIQRSYGSIISTAIAYLCIVEGSAGGSVLECLTRDRGVLGLTGGTALCP